MDVSKVRLMLSHDPMKTTATILPRTSSSARLQKRCSQSTETRRYVRWVLGVAILIGLVAAIASFVPIVLWIVIPLCLPSNVVEMLAGSTFGVPLGACLNLIGKVGGGTIAFLLGKCLGKERVGGYLHAKFPTFRAISDVLSTQSNWKPLLLIQVSSIPNAIKCYGLAITDISVYRFVVSTFLGGLPHAFMWAYIGQQTHHAITHRDHEPRTDKRHPNRTLFMIGGALCTVLAMGFLVYFTKKELRKLQVQVGHHPLPHDHPSDDEETDEQDEAADDLHLPAPTSLLEFQYPHSSTDTTKHRLHS